MKRVKKTARTFVLAIMICMMFVCAAFAAENGSLWIAADESSTGEGTIASIVTDTTVTDGLVEVHYDSEALTFESVETVGEYVAMYAVNADTEGVVKISWVAPGPYESDGSAICLIRVNFSGVEEDSSLTITGTATGADGAQVEIISALDTSELEKAILEAEGLKEELYTEESYAAVEEALAEAEAVLADPTATQEDIDAAAEALREAMDALELKQTDSGSDVDTSELEKAIAKAEGLEKKNYTQKSYAAVEKALSSAKKVLANDKATQAEVDAAAKALNDAIAALVLASTSTPGTGDDGSMVMFAAIAAISAMGIAAVLVIMNNKKGRYAK